jgi:hypothetical protein
MGRLRGATGEPQGRGCENAGEVVVPIKDPDVFKIVEQISEHYQKNISNRFVRKSLMVLDLQPSEWERLEGLTEGLEYHRAQGYQFDEIYEMIISAAHFLYEARNKILPNLRSMTSTGGDTLSGRKLPSGDQERVLRDMALQNFPVNLGILNDLVNELYVKTAALDRDAAGKRRPVYERITELKELGRYLVSS